MKVCTKCSVEKPDDNFFVKDSRTGRRHAQCKACYKMHRQTYQAQHYAKYASLYRARAKRRRAMLRDEFRTNMLLYLAGKSCLLCNESDIRTFELDHINPQTKSFSISQAVRLGYPVPKVLLELEKCRVLCANCHKKITAEQAGWYKQI